MNPKKDNKLLTRREFHALLRKAAQPIQEEVERPSQEASGTSEHHPSDDCTETRRNPNRTEGVEG